MPNKLSPERRRVVLFAASGTILATLPTLLLLPMRQAHWLCDPPYFMGTGFCIGLSIVCLTKAIVDLVKNKTKSPASH